MKDQDIIELYNRRSEQAIQETGIKYGNYCYAISFNICQNEQDAEECVNDTYLVLWNTIPPTQPMNLKSYIGRIVRNNSLNRIKKKNTAKRGKGQYQIIFDELDRSLGGVVLTDETDQIELIDLLNRFLESLTVEHRLVFVGRYWYFDTVSEISKKMGFSQSKTKMILMKCRALLKDYLQKEGYLT